MKPYIGAMVWYYAPADWIEKIGPGPFAACVTALDDQGGVASVRVFTPDASPMNGKPTGRCTADLPKEDCWAWPVT